MKRLFMFGVMAAAILVALTASSTYAQFYHMGGKVVLRNGDPVAGIQVSIYKDAVLRGFATTSSNGSWSFSFFDCNVQGYARVGTQQVTAFVKCDDFTTFPDLVLQCGGPKEPPCPHQ